MDRSESTFREPTAIPAATRFYPNDRRAQTPIWLVQNGSLAPRGLPRATADASRSVDLVFLELASQGRSVDVEITGPELETLVGVGGRVIGAVAGVVPNAQARPIPSLDLSSPEVHVAPKLVQAADLGISATDLGYAVNALVDGAYATDYYVGGDKIDLVILGSADYGARTQDLEGLPIATPRGVIPIGAVATVRLSSGPEQINHRHRG